MQLDFTIRRPCPKVEKPEHVDNEEHKRQKVDADQSRPVVYSPTCESTHPLENSQDAVVGQETEQRPSRPSTPPELLALRQAIEQETCALPDHVSVGHPELNGAISMGESEWATASKKQDVFKHAGLFQEYGGIAGWTKLFGRRSHATQSSEDPATPMS